MDSSPIDFSKAVEVQPVHRRIIRRTEMPPATQQMKNAGQAMIRVARAIVTGGKVERSPAQTAACLQICKGDENLGILKCEEWDENKGRCRQCGCFGNLKARLATEECPLGKWPKVDIPGP